ncbi:plasmid maintenance system killer protein [[Clostridium] leptum]|nr:plasmid maintenance system killer protein [[Clostridium] leptum]
MEVEYRNKSIEKVCTIASVAEKKYGRRMAEKIQLRIDQIRASENVEQMIQFGMGRCHPLHQNRQDQYAVDLIHPMRLVFEKKNGKIQIAHIIEITDYHR